MRLSIASKVFLGFVAVLICSASVSLYGIVRLQRIGRGLSLLSRPYMPLTRAVSTLLHESGALAFWDFAAAAPYVQIEMNPTYAGDDAGRAYKDAIFLSPHKFVGGCGCASDNDCPANSFCNRNTGVCHT